jgi:hypothetical protein
MIRIIQRSFAFRTPGKVQAYGLDENRVLLHEFTSVSGEIYEMHYLASSDAYVESA